MNSSQEPDSHPQAPDLSSYGDVDPSFLERALQNVTNSYKHLLLRAILQLTAKCDGRNNEMFLVEEELATHMLLAAWWPGFQFRLNFGRQDVVMGLIEDTTENLDDLRRNPRAVEVALRRTAAGRVDRLMRYVPQRLIRPWFDNETRGLADHKVDPKIRFLSAELFEERTPLYRIEENPNGLTLHPKWVAYISSHRAVVEGWANARWLEFLERRNPNVPSLGAKIARPDIHRQLTSQRKLWDAVLSGEGNGFRCIYTGEPLRLQQYQLDHFVPWSFVSHDRIWNLTPVPPSINATKNDALPHQRFIEVLAEQHARFAHCAERLANPKLSKDWNRAVDDWSLDLRLDPKCLRKSGALKDAYLNTHGALLNIAGRMGFPIGWHPN